MFVYIAHLCAKTIPCLAVHCLLLVSVFSMQMSGAQGASVSGVVLDAVTGAPLADAAVGLGLGEVRTTTDSEGRFAVYNVEPKNYEIWAKLKGFAGTLPFSRRLQLNKGQSIAGIIIRLWPEATIGGRIVNKAGEPVEASVYLLPARADFNFRGASTRTGNGVFHFSGLSAGTYRMYAQVASGSKTKYELTHYPSSYEFSDAKSILLQVGEKRSSLDIVLRDSLPTVATKVHYHGIIPEGVFASLECLPFGREPEPLGTREVGRIDSKGFSTLALRPGKCHLLLTARSQGRREPFLLAAKEIDVLDSMPDAIELPELPRYKVKARVFLPNGQGELKTGGEFYVNSAERNLNLFKQRAKRGDGGWLVAENLAPGLYQISSIELPEGLYVQSILSAGRSLLQTGLDLRSGAPEPISMQLANDGGIVSGVATEASGSPCAGCAVILSSDSQHQQERSLWGAYARCDTEGKFTAVGVAPGRYKVILHSGDARRELETVQVPAGGKIQLSLQF